MTMDLSADEVRTLQALRSEGLDTWSMTQTTGMSDYTVEWVDHLLSSPGRRNTSTVFWTWFFH